MFFMGMPGSGKSYWGSTVATAYSLPFIDLDARIQERVGMQIADYFEKYGEHEFRLREQETLLDVIHNKEKNHIVACGGGTPVFFNNLTEMKKAGCTIYLDANIEYLLQRLANSPTRRPLLEGKELNKALLELYHKRNPFFSQADYIFDIENISVSKFENILPSCIGRH